MDRIKHARLWLVGILGMIVGVAVLAISEFIPPDADAGHEVLCNISLEDADDDDDVMCGQPSAEITINEFCCVGVTGTPDSHVMDVSQCNATGGACAQIDSYTVTVTAGEACYSAATATVDADKWWQVATDGDPTTAAGYVHCEVKGTR